MALTTNPLFSKENLKNATSSIDWAVYILCYDNNGLPQQAQAGERLRQAKWILATVCSHIFDYYPAEYFMNDEEVKFYKNYLNWFMEHMSVGLRSALNYVENEYAALETITRDELNQHRVPKRKPQEEANVKAILEALIENEDELFVLLNSPKKVTDPEKPSAELIQSLLERISAMQDGFSDFFAQNSEFGVDPMDVFRVNQSLELFKQPLRQAWEVYHYGTTDHFWEEGGSMSDYWMYELNAEEIINKLIASLNQNSIFGNTPEGQSITKDLLRVYKHLLEKGLKEK